MNRAAILVTAALAACSAPERPRGDDVAVPELESPADAARTHASFGAYYHRGLAELNRYALSQSRYGETHDGEAVLVFVTEEFHEGSQVKYEGHGDRADVIEVLKLIAYRSFATGIYPYTVSTTVYDPVDPARPSPIKAVGTVVEWCGATFMQWNRAEGGFRVDAHSYFETEADRVLDIPDALLEDQLFTAIRRDPASLPIGEHRVVPALHHLRFAHLPIRAYAARIERERGAHPSARGPVERYTLRYPELGRTVRIFFGAAFPHEIFGFEEEVERDGRTERTTARRTHAGLDDYWNHNGRADAPYRAALGITGGVGAPDGIHSAPGPLGTRGDP